MRFLIFRKADPQTEAGDLPSERLIADMMRYNESMVNAGIMRAGEGLHPTSRGVRIKFHNGQPTVSPGPFTGDLVAGFTIIEVKSREEAVEWARRWPPSDGNGEVELEVRQVLEAKDFGEAFTADLQAEEVRLRQRVDDQ